MKFIFIFLFSIIASTYVHADTRQRSNGVTADDIKWQVYFNFPVCDHSASGQRKGAWCETTDVSPSQVSNGVENNLINWINDAKTKSLYISYFSFSNKNIAAALCVATSTRPDLNVTVFLDRGEAQVGTFANNLETLDNDISDPKNRRYVEGYKKGCGDRLRPRETSRGSGAFGGDDDYLQHAKIFMALETPTIPSTPEELENWLKTAGNIRFTSSSANMSSFGTTLHFENWLFFDSPAATKIAQQNICTMMAFKNATGDEDQHVQFKTMYQACESKIQAAPTQGLEYFVVPSFANNDGDGPEAALKEIIGSAKKSIKVAIHRLTTTSVVRPLIQKVQEGIPVSMIQDDDTLRASVENGGAAADTGEYDARILCQSMEGGIDVTFMETNSSTMTHMFHNKFVVVDDSTVFQGAGNFTSAALNTNGTDGNYEQFYVITIPELAKAYAQAWGYMREISTKRQDHPVGNNPFLFCN